jgi:hypothetical protein
MPMFEGFQFMVRIGDPTNSTVIRQRRGHTRVYPDSAPLADNDLRPNSLTLLLGVYSDGV